MKKGPIFLSQSNIEILMFIWKWKVATTQLLSTSFFPSSAIRRVYNRLWKLRRAGIIQVQFDKAGRVATWSLTRKGFEIVRDRLPTLRADGYLSENAFHDLMVVSFQLGEWVGGLPVGADLVTEQELRCYKLDQLPSWLPEADAHRPDGYWHLSQTDGNKTFAVEVELSRKSISDYGFVAEFYDLYSTVNRVIWLVDNRSLGVAIDKKIRSEVSGPSKHNFLALDQYLQHSWNAKFFTGPEAGISINQLLAAAARTSREHVLAPTLIDGRLFPRKSRSYKFVVPTINAD
jgi:hypothetical protein